VDLVRLGSRTDASYVINHLPPYGVTNLRMGLAAGALVGGLVRE
jgi:hypothetical protein